MSLVRMLDEALSCADSSFYCVSESGVSVVVAPSAFEGRAASAKQPNAPLDPFDRGSAGAVVSAFLEAVTDGYGNTVAVLDDGTHRLVEIFNRYEDLGCAIVCMAVTAKAPEPPCDPNLEFPARRITSRMDAGGRSIEIDEGFTRLLGWTRAEYRGMSSLEKTHPDDHEQAIRAFAELLAHPGGQTRNRQRVLHRDGRWRWFEITHTNLLHTDDPHVFSESFDISEEMEITIELQERKALLDSLTESLPVGVLHLRPNGEPDISNESWGRLTNTQSSDGLEGFLGQLENADALRFAIEAARGDGLADDVAVTFVDEEAFCKHADLAIRPLPSEMSPFGLLLTLTDMSESVAQQASLLKQSRHDHLTGILNRLGIEEKLTELLTDRRKQRLTVLYCDLDGFKIVNDTFGHSAGDAVLTSVATAITEGLRPEHFVGRIGGDEFVVVLSDLDPIQTQCVADRIERRLRECTDLLVDDHKISIAIGAADVQPGDDVHALLRRADKAMYEVKAQRNVGKPTNETPGEPSFVSG